MLYRPNVIMRICHLRSKVVACLVSQGEDSDGRRDSLVVVKQSHDARVEPLLTDSSGFTEASHIGQPQHTPIKVSKRDAIGEAEHV